MRRRIALILSLLLLLGCAACSGQTAQQQSGQSASFSAEDTLQAEPNTAPRQEEEPRPAVEAPREEATYGGIGENEIVLTVNGEGVTWEEFRYWLFAGLNYQGIVPDESTDWDAVVYDEITLREYAMEDAIYSAILYNVVDQNAAEKGITITEEDEQELDGIMQSNIEYAGGEEAFQQYLDDNRLTYALMREMLKTSFYYSDLFTEMFGAKGEKMTEQEVLLFGEENGFFRAKHILMSNQDAEGAALDEEAMAAKREQLERILEEIRAAEDPAAVFDARMWDFSEDPGLSAYPDGYQFLRGDMVQAFQDAVESLEDYGISDVIEMEYGYSIVMRLPLDPDGIAISEEQYGYTLRYDAATYAFEQVVQSWIDEADVEYTDVFERIDPATAW